MAYSNNPNLPRARASALRMLLQDGVPLGVVAKRYGAHRTTIYRWKNKWRELNKHVEFTNPNRPARPVSMSNKLSYCRWLIPTGSARPHTSPNALPNETVDRILTLRYELKRCAEVIWFYLTNNEGVCVSLSSVKRTLARNHEYDRPKIINQLGRYGDLEGDTIFGKDTRDRLLTHVDRRSGLGSISLLIGYNSTDIVKQTKEDVGRVYGKDNVFTIAYDNRVEFSAWRATERQVQVDIYFADPYKSSQRGRSENFNGLIRDFLPKGTDFKKLTVQDILDIENLLNNRPRKRLGGLTPLEVFRKNCAVKVLT